VGRVDALDTSGKKLVAWAALVATLAAIAFAGRFFGGSVPKNAVYRYSLAGNELFLFGIVLLVILLIARGVSQREAFALRRPSSWGRALGLAAGVWIGVAVLGSLLAPYLHAAREQGLTPTGWEPAHAGAFVASFAALALLGPIVEELTFRGLGFRLLQRYGETAAILISGVAFGIWHGLVYALPILAAFGMGLGYLRSRTRSVFPGMILHACFNAVALVLSVTT
jgi:membrane protease YdiL (CAAX protease family)